MAWIILLFAGLLEVAWAVGLKLSDGFTRLWPSVGTVVAMGGSVFLLAGAMREIPLGTAYGVWVGIGTVGVAIVGILAFNESVAVPRMVFLALLVVSIVGLKATSG